MQSIKPYKTALKCFTIYAFLLFLPPVSHSSQLFYTLQTGSFTEVSAAHKQFNSIVSELSSKQLDHLRIEKIGRFYCVRLGKFESYSAAKKFHNSIETWNSKSIIIDAYIRDQRIIKVYKASLPSGKDPFEEKPHSSAAAEKINSAVTEMTEDKTETEISTLSHERKGDKYVAAESFLLAVEEYRQAINQGINHPNLYRKLSSILYKTGFVDEAIVEMEKAVSLLPCADILRLELGVLYFATDRLEKAKEQFSVALKNNPGLTRSYYYLGEIFLSTGDYDMAWLCVNLARRYGYRGQYIIQKLSILSKEPDIDPWIVNKEDLYIRQILVNNYKKAENIVDRISGGELFEDIAFKESLGPNANVGGFMGEFEFSDMHPELASELLEREVLSDPIIVETEQGFHIIQRIAPFDLDYWEKLLTDSDRLKK